MYITGKIRIKAVIPDALSRLEDLACNLWWTWNPEALLFKMTADYGNDSGNPVASSGSKAKSIQKAMTIPLLKTTEELRAFDRYMAGTIPGSENYPSRVIVTLPIFSQFGLRGSACLFRRIGSLSETVQIDRRPQVPMIAVGLFCCRAISTRESTMKDGGNILYQP